MSAFKQAHWYRRGRRGYNGDGKIHGVVAHSMEAPEKGTTAESVASYFANGSGGRPSSADWCFDSNSEVECVKPTDEAYHAPPASRWTRGYEHAGYARQSAADWHDPFSWAMLQRSAKKLAEESKQFKFPLVYLDLKDLKAGHINGVTTHNDVSLCWKQSTHTDPGPGFPMEQWLEMAAKGAGFVTPPKPSATLQFGDSGPAVGFYQFGLNVLYKQRIPASGKGVGAQLIINEKNPMFGAITREATREFQRFCVVMWEMSGKKGPKPEVTGVADPVTISRLGYWVNIVLKDVLA